MSTPTPDTDVEQVGLANTAFYEAMERGDFETLSSLWLTPADLGVDEEYHDPADAGVVSCVHPGWPVLSGRGEVLRSYALIMANTEYIQFFLTDVHVSVTGDTALVTCTENILSGGPPPTTATSSGRSSASWSSPRTCSAAPPTAGSSGRTTRPPCWPKPVRKRATSLPTEDDLRPRRSPARAGGRGVVVGITYPWVGTATNP
ncbi:hypothetical protein SAV14893_041470 [Streptomyces avermitilis]|uniref:SnoaL-like domain-containing protein n=1 Tax=Streptomyces avermitilis TaxID=33903 RepID=A0A4D4LWA2_STRAX|nr:hypothetical protein SAVMC3_53480 [Streptomyces avermitilis]GDY64754.1 hypothetical protein SAV14893_041470 [Streptomyces avermitilis]GDY84081.1 hypothetical protein SAVCW2_32800 [Streptomyces avermitilis]